MNKPKTETFGYHYMLDCYECDVEKLGDMDVVFDALDKLPEKIGMKKIITPYVVKAGDNGKKDPGGYSGFVMIAESHISIHTFVRRKFTSIDVYSCKWFDPDLCQKYFLDIFKVGKYEEQFIERAKEYPAENIA